ncbi:MAG: hypothetical protein ACRDTA_22605 [Pseudonocardiaceae bacterium]
MAYPKVSASRDTVSVQPSFPGLEADVLRYWAAATFPASVAARPPGDHEVTAWLCGLPSRS